MENFQSSGLILSLEKDGTIHLKIPTDTEQGVQRIGHLIQGMRLAGDTAGADALCDLLLRMDEMRQTLSVVTGFSLTEKESDDKEIIH
jgi:hypothetical protein